MSKIKKDNPGIGAVSTFDVVSPSEAAAKAEIEGVSAN